MEMGDIIINFAERKKVTRMFVRRYLRERGRERERERQAGRKENRLIRWSIKLKL
jgi:hypothetical protein